MDFQQKIIPSENILFQELDGEAVIINLDDESFYSLDDVGTQVWLVLQDAETIADAYEQLLAEYDVQPEQLRNDMAQLIQSLCDAQLISLQEANH